MKALIFDSGIGKRLGDFTQNHPKCLINLDDGETVFHRQLRLLSQCGIREVIVTTGPFPEQLAAVAAEFNELDVTFVHSDRYAQTNYIYSMYLASDRLGDGPMLLMHGDLVFDKGLVEMLLKDPRPDLCLYNEHKALPEKDFKARFRHGILKEVSIDIFDSDCYAFQALYKLSQPTLQAWLTRVAAFVATGNDKVYAENALNEITDRVSIQGVSYAGHYIDEIDNLQDRQRVAAEIAEYDRSH